MSYRLGTPHYNLPQTEGSDNRDWFDTNECFAQIDAAIWTANETASTGADNIAVLQTDVQNLKDKDVELKGEIDALDGRLTVVEGSVDRLEGEIADVNQDLKDAICAIEEASATAAYAHTIGEYFWYNDTLYKTTQNIAIGQQIVPNTNCETTNVTTELLAQAGGAKIDDSSVSTEKVWSSSKTNTLLGNKADTSNVYTKAQVDALIAGIGGGMPVLDLANKVVLTTSDYTTTKKGAIIGSMPQNKGLSINGETKVIHTANVSGSATVMNINFIPAGTTLALASSLDSDHEVWFVPYAE